MLKMFRSFSADTVQQVIAAIRTVTCETLQQLYTDLGLDSSISQTLALPGPLQPLERSTSPLNLDIGHGSDDAPKSMQHLHAGNKSHTEPPAPRNCSRPDANTLSHYLTGPRRVARLGREILARIFAHLIAPFMPNESHYRPSHMLSIFRASHVCRAWRAAALQHPSLWTSLHALSVNEMEHLDELLARSAPHPIQLLSLQFVTHRRLDFIKTCVALQRHLDRVIHLRIHLNPKQMSVFFEVQKALERSKASHLETFVLDFGNAINLRAVYLLKDHAPRLRKLALRSDQLGIFSSITLSGVTHVELLDERQSLTTATLNQIYDHCPLLSHLTLAGPFCDAGDAQRNGAVPRLNALKIHDLAGGDSLRANPTLEFLRHRAVPDIHVISPHIQTYRYTLCKLHDPQELHVIYNGERDTSIRVRAADTGLSGAYVRTFTYVGAADVPKFLAIIEFRGLRSVGFGLHASRPDWEDLYTALGLGAMNRVKVLTLFVPQELPSVRGTLIDIFTYTWERRRHWKLHGLVCIRFDACPPELRADDMTHTTNELSLSSGSTTRVQRSCGAIVAQDVLSFVREGLDVAAPACLCIELMGNAHFVEGGGSHCVDKLRRIVGAVTLLSG